MVYYKYFQSTNLNNDFAGLKASVDRRLFYNALEILEYKHARLGKKLGRFTFINNLDCNLLNLYESTLSNIT